MLIGAQGLEQTAGLKCDKTAERVVASAHFYHGCPFARFREPAIGDTAFLVFSLPLLFRTVRHLSRSQGADPAPVRRADFGTLSSGSDA